MIPTIETFLLDFPKYIDGVCSQDYPTNYQIFLNYSCISLLPEVERIYVHKISMFKMCELCYLQIHIPFRFHYNLENPWHSIVKNEVINTKCQFCETEIVKRFLPAYKYLDCIQQYLDHIGGINLGYEMKSKKLLFACEYYEKNMNQMEKMCFEIIQSSILICT